VPGAALIGVDVGGGVAVGGELIDHRVLHFVAPFVLKPMIDPQKDRIAFIERHALARKSRQSLAGPRGRRQLMRRMRAAAHPIKGDGADAPGAIAVIGDFRKAEVQRAMIVGAMIVRGMGGGSMGQGALHPYSQAFWLERVRFELNHERALSFCFDAFSSREPDSTSLENALVS
jgi:hypothetical protein